MANIFEKVKNRGMALVRRFYALPSWVKILILFLFTVSVRLIFIQPLLMELDEHFFARMARDIYHNISTGKIFSLPINHHTYYGIEYRPFMYSLLAALFTFITKSVEWSMVWTSIIFGSLTVIPVYLLANRLWGRPAGEVASILFAFHPQFIYYSLTGLSEATYTFFFMMAVYFAIVSYEQERGREIIYSAIFWGFAYLTRFEALIGAFLTGLILLYRIFDKKSKDTTGKKLLKALTFGLVFFLIISPYLLIIYKTSGEFSLASPAKQLYDLSEGLFISTGGLSYDEYNYNYGDPGEYDYKTLLKIAGEKPTTLYKENFKNIIFPAMIKSIPLNFMVARANLSYFLILLLIVPLVGKWKLKDPRVFVLQIFFMPAIASFLFQFWSPAPRYFAFLAPLVSIDVSGILKSLWEEEKPTLLSGTWKKNIFMWVLIPASVLFSWYLWLPQPYIPDYFTIDPSFAWWQVHNSIPVILLIFVGFGLLAFFLPLIWGRIYLSFLIPSLGLGALVLIGSAMDVSPMPAVSVREIFQNSSFEPFRFLLLWFLLAGLFYDLLIYIKDKTHNLITLQKRILLLAISFMFICNFQNVWVLMGIMEKTRYERYNQQAVEYIKEHAPKRQISVMAYHPRDPFVLEAKWIKLLPTSDMDVIRKQILTKKPDYIIIDSGVENMTPDADMHPVFVTLAEEGIIKKVWEGKKKPPYKDAPVFISRVYEGPGILKK